MSESGENVAPKAKRPRMVRRFALCCQELARRVVDACNGERDAGRHSIGITRPMERAAAYLGLDRSNLNRLLKSDPPPQNEPEDRFREMMLTEEQEYFIRPAIASLIVEKVPVTLNSILNRVREDALKQEIAWPYSRSTLRKIMNERLQISFRKRSHTRYTKLREDPANCLLRATYLKRFFEYYAERRPFVFMDESWLNKNMMNTLVWSDGEKDLEPMMPSGKGPRWILIGAGCKELGWLQSTIKMWTGKSMNEDYHTEMNWEVFVDWLKNSFLEEVKRNKSRLQSAVLVMDRASYHTVLTNESRAATTSMKKSELVDWILRNNCKKPVSEGGEPYTKAELEESDRVVPTETGDKMRTVKGYTKYELLQISSQNRPEGRYEVVRIIERFNLVEQTDVRVLVLPVAHPQLNPIELVWSDVKRYVRSNNFDCDMKKIRALAEARMKEQGELLWEANFKHMMSYARKQWAADSQLAENGESSEQMQNAGVSEDDEDEDDSESSL